MDTHESIARRPVMKASSNRTFGIVFAVFFAIVAFVRFVRSGQMPLWAMGLSILFLTLSFAAPQLLTPFNRLWTALGALLHRITNPIILGALYYLVFTPFGWFLRLLGNDFLRLRAQPRAASYWIVKQPSGPPPGTMSSQF